MSIRSLPFASLLTVGLFLSCPAVNAHDASEHDNASVGSVSTINGPQDLLDVGQRAESIGQPDANSIFQLAQAERRGVRRGNQQGGRQRGGSPRSGSPRDRVRPRDAEFLEKFPIGGTLPDSLELYNVDHERVAANSVFESQYTVIVGGCLTCPAFRNSYPEIEAVFHDFQSRGVQFYFLYQSLAHPENWGYVQPTSIEERLAQIERAKKELKTSIPWLSDTMRNEMKTHFAMTPNSQFVFDGDGRIVHRTSWGRGESLRAALVELVGEPETITTVADLGLPRFSRQSKEASENLVERISVEGVAVPLRVAAGGQTASLLSMMSSDFGESKRYAKLRPEADQGLLSTGNGQLYLGFRQDPVLGAAWNNLAGPLRYQVICDAAKVSRPEGDGPTLSVESDNEPREFLLDIEDWNKDEPLTVKIQYFACHKELGWCKPVSQEFTVWLEQDHGAGAVNGRSHFPGGRRTMQR